MKKSRLLGRIALLLMAMLSLPLSSQAADKKDKTYRITFGARGDTRTVERVIVENLNNKERVELKGNETLFLTEDEHLLGIETISGAGQSGGIDVRLADGKLTISGGAAKEATMTVHTASGILVHHNRVPLDAGKAQVSLPSFTKGVYIVSVKAGRQTKNFKWVGGPTGSLTTNDKTSATAPFTEGAGMMSHAPMMTTEDHPFVALRFADGDLLRFTGISGKMKTVMLSKPITSSNIWFDFFKCEDADGRNYATIRIGDLIWMAEYLGDVNNENILDASSFTENDFKNHDTANPKNPVKAVKDGMAFYSLAAAKMALPEGWQLPTQGEVDNMIKKCAGGDYAAAAPLFLSLTNSDIDSTRLGLTVKEYFYRGMGTSKFFFLLTRSTKRGKPVIMKINEEGVVKDVNYGSNELYAVRGVRPAPSDYTEMLEALNIINTDEPAMAAAATDKRPPLGETYSKFIHPQSIAYDFSSGQYYSSDNEERSGLIYKDSNGDWQLFKDKRDGNFLSDVAEYDVNRLRKLAAMSTSRGSQYLVEMQWSRPMLLWSYKNSNGSQKWNPAKAQVFGKGGVYLTVLYDRGDNWTQSFNIINEPSWTDGHKGTFINLKAYMQPLTADQLPWFKWDGGKRPTESRFDYVQRVFQLLTADFNDDGVDELVIHIDGEVWVFDGAILQEKMSKNKSLEPTAKNGLLYHKNFNLDDDGKKIVPHEKFYFGKVVTRIAVGDVDGDKVSDIFVMQVGTGQGNYGYHHQLRAFSKGNLNSTPLFNSFEVSNGAGDGNGIVLDAKIGNVSNGKYNDILTLRATAYNKNPTPDTDKWEEMYIHHYMYAPEEEEKLKSFFAWDNEIYQYMRTDARGRVHNANLTIVNFRGPGYPGDLVVCDQLHRWKDGHLRKYKQIIPDVEYQYTYDKVPSILADNIIAADPNGNGKELLYYFQTWSTYDSNVNKYHFVRFSEVWMDNNGEFHVSGTFNQKLMKYCDYGKQWNSDMKDYELMWWNNKNDIEWGANPTLCAVNDIPGKKTLKYKGYAPTFSEPRIHALLAAPPTYDYGNDTRPDYDFVTSWGYSTSTGTTTLTSNSIRSKLIAGFEHEINAPLLGTKLGGVEFTASVENEVELSHGSSSTTTFGQLYEARDDNRVVMQITPYDCYTYEVVQSDNEDEIGGEVYVAIPQKPMTVGLALSDYDRWLGNTPQAPKLSNVFRHTIGNPFSYPSSDKEIDANVNGKILWGANKWDDFVTTGSGGSTIREIQLDNSSSYSQRFSFNVDTELVTTIGCAKIGLGAGYGNTNTTTHEESQGFSVSACVPGLAPGDKNAARKFFDWNICWYKYTLGGQTFPVVNYIVKRR